ncbi:Uncharacterized protein DBV15_03632 [Temnothorax longispinosus]|uniref:Uncharacterized protein n=1 Tax=Temnothorax longispinosus TaxID=300112 RepID=A0A4S2KL43_9HYME|nr:Uncharacterized protein DBV15_03632 [Temnothorax longispinosus]
MRYRLQPADKSKFPERARTHQLRGISTVSHFLNVGQMCRDVRRRTVEGVDPETWYGRVVTLVAGLRGEGQKRGKRGEGGVRRWSIGGRERTEKRNGIFRNGRAGGKRERGRSAGLLNGIYSKTHYLQKIHKHKTEMSYETAVPDYSAKFCS